MRTLLQSPKNSGHYHLHNRFRKAVSMVRVLRGIVRLGLSSKAVRFIAISYSEGQPWRSTYGTFLYHGIFDALLPYTYDKQIPVLI
jgi:hypothetical protein